MVTTESNGDADLDRFLLSHRRYHPLYGDRLANHLPMATIALWRLGGDAKHIQRFSDNYAKRLRLRDTPDPLVMPSTARVGSIEFESNAVFFAAQLARASAESVLRQWVPRLLPGLSSSAFHGLIRTAYAYECGRREELADALAFWMAEFAEFPHRAPPPGPWPKAMVDAVVERFKGGRDFTGIIVDRMSLAAQDPLFSGIGPGPLPGLHLDCIRREVLALYALRDDFTLLHTVTATHAMRVLHPFWGNDALACAYLWQGVLLAVATVAPAVAESRAQVWQALPDASWDAITARARDSLDDHVIKLVYTAQQESRMGDSDMYRRVAARKVGIAA